MLDRDDHLRHTVPEVLVAAERARIPAMLLSTSQTVLDRIGATVPCHAVSMPFDLNDFLVTVERALRGNTPVPFGSVVQPQAPVQIVPAMVAPGLAAAGGDQ